MVDFVHLVTTSTIATEITNFNVKEKDMRGECPITNEHVKNNRDVRGLLAKSGIKPENLPPEEDINKLQRRVRSEDRKLLAAKSKDQK